MANMTERQQNFCREYLIDCNATLAAIRAGYSPSGAAVEGSRLLRKANIRAEISRLAATIHEQKVADAVEVMEYLTAVLRGEQAAGRGQVRAAELLAKRYGLLSGVEPLNKSEGMLVKIIDDIGG